MSIYRALCTDIASWRRRIEYYQREAIELSRVGNEDEATIYRQGVASAIEWTETLNRQKEEIEGLCHAARESKVLQP